MPYMLLIQERADERKERAGERGRQAAERMGRFTASLKERGLYRSSDSLRSAHEGVRIEVRGGKPIVVDGPFAESKEVVAGIFFLDCATKEEAVAIASECPAAEWGTVEVREIGPCWDGGMDC